jgi:two-component system, NarL family, sensor kinase
MATVRDRSSQSNPQLPSHSAGKLRGIFSTTGDGLLSAGLCYGLLAFYAAVIYVLVLAFGGVSGTMEPPWWLNLLALLIIVPTFLPMHRLLRRSVNELVYGQHDNPYALLARLNERLESASAPDTLLPTVAATLAATLNLPYVAIEIEGAEAPAATYGEPPRHAEIISIPLAYQASTLGTLRISSRRAHEGLSGDDTRLLLDMARQIGITLHAAQLSDALQASREQLVLAREEERRRIRRDLHDGLGPTLASLRLQLSALRHRVGQNPEAEHLIDELRADVRAATAEIRRLVYDLRPPMLDEFGLLGALRNLELTDDGLQRSVEAPAELPPLPAAVEVAIYRIAAEALHNIVRHAQATRCTISIVLDETTLTLTVTDNGCGLPATYLAGVGHHSMYERAAELGGSVAISPTPSGGTCVSATFPLKQVQHD